MKARHILQKTVSAITVTYNSEAEIDEFIASCARNQCVTEIIVIDNASKDETVHKLEKSELRNLKLIKNRTNAGLARANNQGIKLAEGEYTLICNPDISFGPDAVASLVAHLSELNACAIGPVNVDERDIPHSSFHRNWTLAHVLVWRLFPARIVRSLYSVVRNYRTQEVKFVSGSFLLARTDDLRRIGGYDEAFFLSVEDACDLCERLKKISGKPVYLSDRSRVRHFVSKSAASEPTITQWMGAVGTMHYFRKKGPIAGNAAWVVLMSSFLYRYLRATKQNQTRQKRLFLNLFNSRLTPADEMIRMASHENEKN